GARRRPDRCGAGRSRSHPACRRAPHRGRLRPRRFRGYRIGGAAGLRAPARIQLLKYSLGRHLSSMAPVAILAATLAVPASAETLRAALANAYHDNPTIAGARAQQRANDENVPIAKAAGRPGVSATGSLNDNLVRTGNSFTAPARIAQLGVTLNVPVYSGGAVRNSIRAAETRVEAGQASLRGTEATTFTNVVAAYNNVLRDEAIVGLNAQNVKV